ncbi:unnamed protein product [Penicillium discolor]
MWLFAASIVADSGYAPAAFWVGILTGIAVFLGGAVLGGRIFERSGERLMEFVETAPDQGGVATLDRELEELLREENIEPGDHERFSHYVKKDKILESAITGKPVRALCGKKWTPGRDPEKFPICPTCKEIYESMVR